MKDIKEGRFHRAETLKVFSRRLTVMIAEVKHLRDQTKDSPDMLTCYAKYWPQHEERREKRLGSDASAAHCPISRLPKV